MIDSDPILRGDPQPEDVDRALRLQELDAFIGQAEARVNLKVFIESARRRGVAMDHTLFYGPPGLGKTTLSQIIARELGVNFRMTSGPVLAKAGDLAAILTNLEARDVLFIDEIHRLNPVVEEVCTRRWKILNWTSSSVKALLPARSESSCDRSPSSEQQPGWVF